MKSGKHKVRGRKWWLTVLLFVVLVAAASYITLRREFRSLSFFTRPEIVAEYADALSVALLFFDVQKAGELERSRITWRGDSAMEDGKEANLDLSRGLFDAGDNMKLSSDSQWRSPRRCCRGRFSNTTSKWGREAKNATESLKWITDYLINAHPSLKDFS